MTQDQCYDKFRELAKPLFEGMDNIFLDIRDHKSSFNVEIYYKTLQSYDIIFSIWYNPESDTWNFNGMNIPLSIDELPKILEMMVTNYKKFLIREKLSS